MHRILGQPLEIVYLVVNAFFDLMYTNHPYPPRHLNPRDTLFHAPRLSNTDRANFNNILALQLKLYDENINMDMALIKLFYELLKRVTKQPT